MTPDSRYASDMEQVVVKDLGSPDRSQDFLDGSHRDVVVLRSVVMGRGVYRPGWRWSAHAGPLEGGPSSGHVGYIVSGRMGIRGPDGKETSVGPGEGFEAAKGHDAWMVGDEPCVALDFGAI